MEQNLDKLLDKIIIEEGKRYTSITVNNTVYRDPSYFKYIKEMYFKSWEGPINPNNVFIPYILVCLEGILRQIISIDKTITKKPVYPRHILDRLTNDMDSPLVNVKPDIVYSYWYPDEKEPDKYTWKAESLSNNQLEYVSNYLKLNKEKFLVVERDKTKFLSNLGEILDTIYTRYYKPNPKTKKVYRNIIMHANKSLLLEDDSMFSIILDDYCKLISSIWGDEIMHYEKEKEKTPFMFNPEKIKE
ncbi:hypothetical protein [Lactococcus formosensis]|uniref:hypothetical protein n=1 Tax=Lactococcus formosensis TaxID=1281486 RepID=UPI001BD06E3E|nr:hypothetical protein [Lactococcus formosensis]